LSSPHLTWGVFWDVRNPQHFCCAQGEQSYPAALGLHHSEMEIDRTPMLS